MIRLKKWEISLLAGVAAAALWCAASPRWTGLWWTTAFSPLCDGLLGGGDAGGELVLRSKVWELVSQYLLR